MEGENPQKKVKTDSDALAKLKAQTSVVADTGEFSQIKQFEPEDATTNPSLILKAANVEEYKQLIQDSIEWGKENYFRLLKKKPAPSAKRSSRKASKIKQPKEEEKQPEFNYTELDEDERADLLNLIVDKLSVSFGAKILELVPGYVSTEVDARLSFDKKETVKRAKRIIQLYEEMGISKDRILIKIAATWEGIQAGSALKKDKIKTNMTLIFGYSQALACGQAGLHLISPFVGRIYDWHKKKNPGQDFEKHNCPGVKSVTNIYNYFKKYEIETIVMGASFRNIGQIIELAGCDKLTISPKLLQELAENKDDEVKQRLSVENVKDMDIDGYIVDEQTFRWHQNEDECMSDLLPAGIRAFSRDIEKLEALIEASLKENPKAAQKQEKEQNEEKVDEEKEAEKQPEEKEVEKKPEEEEEKPEEKEAEKIEEEKKD